MADVTVRPLDSLADFHRCVQIAREVWGDCELDTEPFVTFVVARYTGGQVLGAFDGDILVGFTKAFVGLHNQTPYLHSHMAAVLSSYRDRGIGRQLKLFQREDALRRGIRLIEWTFDPLESKNAYFNIHRLGGISRRYMANFYGITSSPLHRGLPTDRLLVEWHLDSRRVVAAVNDLSAETRDSPVHVHLPAPARPVPFARARQNAQPEGGKAAAAPAEATCSSQLIEIQSRLRSELTTWFSKGYAVTGVRSALSGVDYCLAPYSDF